MKNRFKRGLYYIGDPYYTTSNKQEWSAIVNATNHFKHDDQILNGKKVAIKIAHEGNGTYCETENESKKYDVYSTTLGIIPFSEVTNVQNAIRHGNVVLFKDDFDIMIEDGVFTFGHITINTNNDQYSTLDFD